ncbi:prolyl 3-hydroxylase sudestada1 isoform X2 [Pieris rapae]|uniref:prolyl 3-hydroxylase sudestada1 isoform X2 n=1 Tax=Pieris rapae TaxID=64459 RepID=UPI001E27A031|nr:prolyl 3-hydroxylase sudestada1 isoform X2 [Pieris rapae]
MSSPRNDTEESSVAAAEPQSASTGSNDAGASGHHQAAKRRLSTAVIEISDTDSDDSDVCAVNSYQASADEVKRIRKDYTSSSSSSSDYSSDSESPWEDDSIVVKDKFETKAKRAELNPRANRMDEPQLNPAIKLEEVIDRLTSHWKEDQDHSSKEVTLTCQPFKVCRVHNLLANPEIINNIVDDMNTLDWTRKKMDLYEFHQTTDLANLTWQRSIRGIYELLKNELKNWVSQVTGLELHSVSASCSLYGPGDHLLIHDDQMTDRRVAFIFYLAPWQPPDLPHHIHNGDGESNHKGAAWGGWAESMGGALELFARDDSGAPADVERRLYPANNTLAFFRVGKESFHQVGEVLSMELPRLSINGWFHGPASETSAPPPEDLVLHKPHSQVTWSGSGVRGAIGDATCACPPRGRRRRRRRRRGASRIRWRGSCGWPAARPSSACSPTAPTSRSPRTPAWSCSAGRPETIRCWRAASSTTGRGWRPRCTWARRREP